jgi:hypothetical protein
MYWTSSSGSFELNITKAQAASCSHQGPCDADVFALSQEPGIRRQLRKFDKLTLVDELREYGAWDSQELDDHDQNLQRVLWLACGDINEGR